MSPAESAKECGVPLWDRKRRDVLEMARKGKLEGLPRSNVSTRKFSG